MPGQSEAVDPTDPVFPSNLSAAQYELGQYAECIKTIVRAWLLLKKATEPKPDLALRLFNRLGKAMVQGVAEGSFNRTVFTETLWGIESLKHGIVTLALRNPENTAYSDAVLAWSDMLHFKDQIDSRRITTKRALARLHNSSALKKSPYVRFDMLDFPTLP